VIIIPDEKTVKQLFLDEIKKITDKIVEKKTDFTTELTSYKTNNNENELKRKDKIMRYLQVLSPIIISLVSLLIAYLTDQVLTILINLINIIFPFIKNETSKNLSDYYSVIEDYKQNIKDTEQINNQCDSLILKIENLVLNNKFTAKIQSDIRKLIDLINVRLTEI